MVGERQRSRVRAHDSPSSFTQLAPVGQHELSSPSPVQQMHEVTSPSPVQHMQSSLHEPSSPSPIQKLQGSPRSSPRSSATGYGLSDAYCRVPTPPAVTSFARGSPRTSATGYSVLDASYRAPTPPATQGSFSVPEPPAPRSWTPSKLASSTTGGPSSSTPRSLTPAEALEREMQELAFVDPGSPATAIVAVQQRPHSSTPNSSSKSGGSGTYKGSPLNTAGPEAAGNASDGLFVRPSSAGSLPHAAQHNNLVMSALGSRPGSGSRDDGWSSQLGLSKLRDVKERLVGHASTTSSTAIEAFSEPPAGTGTSSDGSNPVVVARRKAPAPARVQPANTSHSSRSAAQWEQECSSLLNAGDRLAALQLPGPSNGVVRCYVKRSTNMLGLAPVYELRLESTDECLAVARRRVKSATSSYVISLNGSCSSDCTTPRSSSGPVTRVSSSNGSSTSSYPGREEHEVVGKLKANMLGMEYVLRGKGGDQSMHKGFNAQLLAVNYKPTINHVQAAPRTLTAVIPLPECHAWSGSQPAGSQFDSLAACMKAARARELPMSYERDLVMLHTMKPHFDPIKQVHYLDFKGRVTEVSHKNFQLVHWDHNQNQLGTDLVLLFGKKGHDEFALDFCYPVNPLQAFALGLSSMDSKLCNAL